MQDARPDERFFLSRWKPTPLLVLQLWVVRLVLWGPWPFVSLAVGPLWKERALQMYGGVKCDGSRTFMLRHGQLGGTPDEQAQYVMTTTPKELVAVRIHGVGQAPYDNQGGW